MARIKVVERKGMTIREKFISSLKNRVVIAMLVLLILGFSLLIVAQEYHPTIYTNVGSYQVSEVNPRLNTSFSFSTDGNYETLVNVSFPANDGIRYFIMLNDSYVRNGVEVLLYYPYGSGYQNHSFSFGISNRGVSGNTYMMNITSTTGGSFPVNVSYQIIIPNRGNANPLVQTAGLVLTIGSVIAIATYLTFKNPFMKERRF